MKKRRDLGELFRERVEAGCLPELLASHGTFNVEAGTLGGKVWWRSLDVAGWKLQFNTLSGWWRILNPQDVRVARGTSEEQLRNLLEGRPTSLLVNYFDAGYRFSKTPASVRSGRSVVLVHGWGVRGSSMQGLAEALALEGFDAYVYDYPSAKADLAEQVSQFLRKYRELSPSFSPDEEIFFLTHSMGGLILRGALAQMEVAEAKRIRAIVMLGPPNRGSGLAYLGCLPGVKNVNASLGDMAPTATSYTMTIPTPKWLPPVGIIAGRRDGKVAVEATHLPEPLPHQHIVVESTHPGLRNPKTVLASVLKFFHEGSF